MFRECYFEYAGQSSQPYNLMLCYVENSNDAFDSGGKFDLKTDKIPHSHETFLYGKDYSAEPLEFDVELLNLHGSIPQEQMIKIKNWLFGQDGWKTFRCMDDRQNYHLKCIFEPDEDIVDGTGYRGLRCKLRNASPFWYGAERTKVLSGSELADLKALSNCVRVYPPFVTSRQYLSYYNAFQLDIDDDTMIDAYYYPIITASIDYDDSGVRSGINPNACHFATVDVDSITEAKETSTYGFTTESSTDIAFNNTFVWDYGSSNRNDVITMSTQYGYVKSAKTPSQKIEYYHPTLPYFRLHSGKNFIRVYEPSMYSGIKISFVPLYRMGAF